MKMIGPQSGRNVTIHRKRLLAGALGSVAMACFLALGGGFPFISGGEASAGATGRPTSYVVRPGDTLWGIVERTHPGIDPRPEVDQLSAQLHGGALRSGQLVQLP